MSEREIVEYKLVALYFGAWDAEDKDDVIGAHQQLIIKKMISKGWQPFGNVFWSDGEKDGEKVRYFFQPMVKYKETKHE